MKLIVSIFFLIFLFVVGCEVKEKSVAVWIENNSQVSDEIEFTSYFDSIMVDKRSIKRDSVADRMRTFNIKLPPYKQFVFSVKVKGREQVECHVNLDSITSQTLLHVNFVEKVIHKGDFYSGTVLSQDSIVEKRFYCEVMY